MGQPKFSHSLDTTLTKRPFQHITDSSVIISKDTIVFLLDTISEKLKDEDRRDASDFYNALKRTADKTRLTRELYRLFFVSPDKRDPTDVIKSEQSETPFIQYQGKTIRKIKILILQPFGAKLYDTTLVASTWFEKTANRIHHSSRKSNIRKQLHIKPGDKVDASSLAENERLIRDLPYIEDAYIRVIPVSGTANLVDLEIQTKDQFSWGINFNVSSARSGNVELFNNNLYGLGHQLNNNIHLDSDEDQQFGYTGQYYIKNIGGRFVNSGFTYQNTFQKEVIQFDLIKEFESFYTKYAGGLSISRTLRTESININDPIKSETPLNFNYANLWFGRSFRLKSPTLFTRRKLVLAGRISGRYFFDLADEEPKNLFFLNSTQYLASISLSQTQYFKSNLIYNFGRTEDIPYGHLIQLIAGYQEKELSQGGTYLGFNFEKAFHRTKSRSYLYNRFSLGGFLRKKKFEQAVLMGETKFVSRIRKLGRYRFRNFGSLSYMLGIRRIPGEFIDLNNGNGIRGFKSDLARGNQRLHLNMESVAFSPHMMGGFLFAYFTFADIGIIGSNKRSIFTQDYYYGMGVGIRLRNENLVFKTIQLRFALYPDAPSDFKYGVFRLSGEIRPSFNDFNSGQPQILEYR